MVKTFRIDFFRATMPVGCAFTFQETVGSILGIPAGPGRNHEIHDAPVRIQQGVVNGDLCEGDLIRIQMDGLPLKAGLDGTANPVQFNSDEGLGHETAFLYNIPLRVLLLQRNRSGVSPEAVCRYIERHAETEQPIQLEPIAMPDAVARLDRMAKVRRLRVVVAGLERARQFESQSPSVQRMIGLINDMDSMVLEMELGAGVKRRASISKVGVLATIRGLLGIPADVAEVRRIDVSGRDDDGAQVDTLHLLDFCMTEKATVRTVDRHIPYDGRAGALRRAWNARAAALEQMFGAPANPPDQPAA
jgi:hypothetical protein